MTASAQTFEQLHDWFREMRANSPVLLEKQQGMGIVQLFDYGDVYTALTEHEDFSSDLRAFSPKQADFELFTKGSFIQLDPPEHHNLRGLISKAFTPKVIADLESRIGRITDELLAQAGTQFDLIDALAYPLPVIVIAELLGIPTTDRPLFRRWADTLLSQQVADAPGVDE